MSEILQAALWYADNGWQVFPCRQGSKVPATLHGVKDATTDKTMIHEWWKTNENYNVALACGEGSGVYVIDIDLDLDKGINGVDSLASFPELPRTIMQETPRGGFHSLFRSPIVIPNKNNFRNGIDIRGNGYYIMVTPSVHPNGKLYKWYPGLAPWERDLAEFPKFMIPVAGSKEQNETVKKPSHGCASNSVTPRASAYLSSVPPAVQGSGGHDALLWAAGCLVNGFMMSDDEAYSLLASEYNPRCVPPWELSNKADLRDFKRKVKEARRLGTKNTPGWLLEDTIVVDDIDSQISESFRRLQERSRIMFWGSNTAISAVTAKDTMLAEGRVQVPTSSEVDFITKPVGVLGEFCGWLNDSSRRLQPMFSLGCALAFFGALFGRKVKDEVGTRTNVYCMGLGASSSGKMHSQECVRRLCDEAGANELIGGNDFASDSGIEERLSVIPSIVYLLDEIGHLMSSMKNSNDVHLRKIVPMLMKLYSATNSTYKGKDYADSSKSRVLVQPCLSIWGTSSMDRFSGGLSRIELSDGWLSRCLVFQSRDTPRKNREYIEPSIPSKLIEFVSKWHLREIKEDSNDGDLSKHTFYRNGVSSPARPVQLIAETTKEANDEFYRFDDETYEIGINSPEVNALWARGEENARKIALIVAASNDYDSLIVTEEIANYSCRLIRYLLRDFCEMIAPKISDSAVENKKMRLLSIIEAAGKNGCTLSDLAGKSQWLNTRERHELLQDMAISGTIMSGISGKTQIYTKV